MNSLLPNKYSGFTFLEVMVAISIIAIALTAVYRLQSQTLHVNHITKFAINAPLLAQQKIAEAELQQFDDLSDGEGGFGETFPGYTYKMDIAASELESLGQLSKDFIMIDLIISLNINEAEYRCRAYRFVQK